MKTPTLPGAAAGAVALRVTRTQGAALLLDPDSFEVNTLALVAGLACVADDDVPDRSGGDRALRAIAFLGRVLRLDASSGRTLKRMRVGSQPRDLVLAAGALWVVEQGSSDVRRIPLR